MVRVKVKERVIGASESVVRLSSALWFRTRTLDYRLRIPGGN